METKAGWKTTEFWGMAVTSVITVLNSAMGWNIPVESLATLAIVVAGYAIGRGNAKKTS